MSCVILQMHFQNLVVLRSLFNPDYARKFLKSVQISTRMLPIASGEAVLLLTVGRRGQV